MFFTGIFTICLFMLLSIERYWILYRPINDNIFNRNFTIRILIFSGSFCFLWCIFPLIGWSKYTYEFGRMYCAIDWIDKSFNIISFNVITLIIFFALPLCTILYTNYWIFVVVS